MSLELNEPTLAQKALALIFPSTCICCGEIVDMGQAVCADCEKELEKLEYDDIRKIRRCGRDFYIRAVYYYDKAASESVKLLKFCSNTRGAKFMGRLIAEKIRRMRSFDCDAVTFVPMTYFSRMKRGYNQAQLIAQYAAKELGLPLKTLLAKTGENRMQHHLSGSERRTNVEGMFTARDSSKGLKVLLIDDVVTTGSTICECACALLDAGAESVTPFGFTMTESHG